MYYDVTLRRVRARARARARARVSSYKFGISIGRYIGLQKVGAS
jgi:hypothetical protein